MILETFATAIRPALSIILTSTIFAAMLVPLLISLLYFSTVNTRKKPIFILNVLSIILGISVAAWSDYVQVNKYLCIIIWLFIMIILLALSSSQPHKAIQRGE